MICNKGLTILGSTGSIGTQALDVARMHGIRVECLAARSNIKLLEEQIRAFKPSMAAVVDERAADELRVSVADTDTKIISGVDCLTEAARFEKSDVVLNSIVGIAGLLPTLEAINAGKQIALANKETLVTGGELVINAAAKKGIRIYPVDSEHSAIFQCLESAPPEKSLKKIILTASGGPFFGKTRSELKDITPAQALKHPNWSMGAKITIDSATLMNKGLEVIEAAWLFEVNPDDIQVVVHRESIIHSAVEFVDNSIIAQMGVPDMRIPIQYALTYPQRYPSPVKELDLFEAGTLTFYKPDRETFTCLNACVNAFNFGGTACAAVNGANEEAVHLFLEGKIGFLDIGDLVEGALETAQKGTPNIDDILAADKAAREYVISKIGRRC